MPLWDCSRQRSLCPFPIWCMSEYGLSVELYWQEKNLRTRRKPVPVPLLHYKLDMGSPGSEPGLHCKNPATDRVCCFKVFFCIILSTVDLSSFVYMAWMFLLGWIPGTKLHGPANFCRSSFCLSNIFHLLEVLQTISNHKNFTLKASVNAGHILTSLLDNMDL